MRPTVHATGHHPSPEPGITWESLPSLSYLLGRATGRASNGPVWSDTLPADFEALHADLSEDFVEALPGMSVREVHEPDILRLFFGR
ncbi:MAG TPA: hypothetical protein VF457_08790 [Burkholderiaceae bacterium]